MVRAVLISMVCALSTALSANPCAAQSRALMQFKHTAWTLQDGAPSQIKRMAQTSDGYIWLATASGLVRFDGVSFEAYRLPHGQQLAHDAIQSLTADGDGGLWIGYVLGDTSYLKNGVLTTQRFQGHAAHGGGRVHYMIVRRDGSVWAATDYGLLRLVSGQWKDADEVQGLGIKSSYCLYEDSHRTLWMATELFVYRLPYGARRFEKTQLHPGANGHFAETPDGTVWIADQYGVHDVEDPLATKSHLPFIDIPLDLSVDDTGAIWFLGDKTGVTRIENPSATAKLSPAAQAKAITNFSLRNGLTSEHGSKALKDNEGNLWFATSEGLDKFRRTALTPAPLPASFGDFAVAAEDDGSIVIGTQFEGLQRLQANHLNKVPTGRQFEDILPYRAQDGKLWLAGVMKLGYLEHGHYTDVPIPAEMMPLRDRATQTATVGTGGELWLQQDSRVGLFRLHDKVWSKIPDTAGRPPAIVMATDRADRVWAGYTSGSITIFDRTSRTTLTPAQGLTVGNVSALYPSAEGMWIGGQHGLDIMAGDHPVELRFAGDLKIEGISGITRTEDGVLWLNSLSGVLRIPSDEVNRALKTPTYAMHYRLFTYLDGLSGKPAQIRPLPTIVRGTGTTIWFTTSNGVVSVDTAHLHTNTLVPPVAIKDVVVDGNRGDADDSLTLPKGAKGLQIDYTALSLSIPERVRFRYRLEGYDKDWQDAGTRRQAFYTHLPPGHYTFRVIACNNDGLWNETGATVGLYLPPTFLQSWYFKLLVAVLFFAATWLLYLLRMRRETAKMQARVQERLSERERIARDLHDTLFQSVEGSLLHLNAITSRLTVEQRAKDQLRHAYEEVDRVMGQARSLVFDLRQPVDVQDIGATIKLFAEEVGALSDAQVAVQVRGPYIELKPETYNEVLKVIKECIWNAFRHARPQHIKVEINSSSRVFEVSVTDDGVGIDRAILEAGGREGHWGLPGIRERAEKLKAKLVIGNSDTGGTRILLRIKGAEAYLSRAGFPWHWRGLWNGNGKS
jgi:signal transduction histidine kinase/ligand-binding sensor domain-containing protein